MQRSRTKLVGNQCALCRGALLAMVALGLPATAGCLAPGHALTSREQAAADAARPILSLDPNAVWTDAYNRLVELGPDALSYLMRQPALTRSAAPDDLAVLLHVSLVRLLAEPAAAPPRLSASCLETTLGLVHFELKVGGRRLGTIVVSDAGIPPTWPELFPADFDHALAARIDVETDRRALCDWWAAQHAQAAALATSHRLQPRAEHLWRLLARRYADRWEYLPEPRAVLCAAPPRGPGLLEIATTDYNLVRAACVWLGTTGDATVEGRLIELTASLSPVVSHNARFALRYSRDERIRDLIRRYEAAESDPDAKD